MEIFHSILLIGQSATDAAPAAGNQFMSFLPLIFIFIIFYFLLIRPQQKKQKELVKLVSSLKTGDKIITTAGIHGLITNVKDTTVIVKVADNVKIEFDKACVVTVVTASDTATEKTPAISNN